ncbi:MAG TPA: helix-turn-helix transcriptional regulator [Chloroflexota bacterium]
MALETFYTWLDTQMAERGIKSARRLGLEAGVDPARVSDWLLGMSVPSDRECEVLALYLGVSADEVKERRFPRRGQASR